MLFTIVYVCKNGAEFTGLAAILLQSVSLDAALSF